MALKSIEFLCVIHGVAMCRSLVYTSMDRLPDWINEFTELEYL